MSEETAIAGMRKSCMQHDALFSRPDFVHLNAELHLAPVKSFNKLDPEYLRKRDVFDLTLQDEVERTVQ